MSWDAGTTTSIPPHSIETGRARFRPTVLRKGRSHFLATADALEKPAWVGRGGGTAHAPRSHRHYWVHLGTICLIALGRSNGVVGRKLRRRKLCGQTLQREQCFHAQRSGSNSYPRPRNRPSTKPTDCWSEGLHTHCDSRFREQ